MDRTTEDVAAPLPPKIIEHYKDIHLDIDILSFTHGNSYHPCKDLKIDLSFLVLLLVVQSAP